MHLSNLSFRSVNYRNTGGRGSTYTYSFQLGAWHRAIAIQIHVQLVNATVVNYKTGGAWPEKHRLQLVVHGDQPALYMTIFGTYAHFTYLPNISIHLIRPITYINYKKWGHSIG